MNRIRSILFLLLIFVSAVSVWSKVIGKATYYSDKFHGRRTSSGSVYHKDSLTCAHRSYPFGTLLKVKNPRNGREVIVKVTDRGGFGKSIAIDLSHAAAEELDIVRSGIAKVEISKIDDIGAPYRDEREVPQLKYENLTVGKDIQYAEIPKEGKGPRAYGPKTTVQYGVSRTEIAENAKGDSVPRWRVLGGRLSASLSRNSVSFYNQKR